MNLKKIEKLASKILIRIALLVVIGTLPYMLVINYMDYQKNDENSAMYLFKRIDFRKLDSVEADYLKLGWDIIDRFSARSTRYSMSKEQRIQFLTVNFKLANVFGYGHWDIPIIGILETALNPKAEHTLYGEQGMFGAWPSTAKYYYSIARDKMPQRLWHYVKFTFNDKYDLLDPINGLKMAYIWIWIENQNYKGLEIWTIGGYRRGRFEWVHWKRVQKILKKCETDLEFDIVAEDLYPVSITLKTKNGTFKYNARAYYYSWRNMRDCFERGDIDAGIHVYRKYKKIKYKEDKSEIEFRRVYSALKQKEKEVRECRQLITILDKKLKDVEQADKKVLKVAKQIGGQANKEGWKKYPRAVKKFCIDLIEGKK